MLSVVLACLPFLIGARGPLVSEGLDPTIFGSVLDKATRRTVNSGEELRAFLSDVTVSTLLLNGKCSARITSGMYMLINLTGIAPKRMASCRPGEATRE